MQWIYLAMVLAIVLTKQVEEPTCWDECQERCKNLYGRVTDSCVANCDCPCDPNCDATCDKFGLGWSCKFKCGCFKNITFGMSHKYKDSQMKSELEVDYSYLEENTIILRNKENDIIRSRDRDRIQDQDQIHDRKRDRLHVANRTLKQSTRRSTSEVLHKTSCQNCDHSQPLSAHENCEHCDRSMPMAAHGNCEHCDCSMPMATHGNCEHCDHSQPLSAHGKSEHCNGDCEHCDQSQPMAAHGNCKQCDQSQPMAAHGNCEHCDHSESTATSEPTSQSCKDKCMADSTIGVDSLISCLEACKVKEQPPSEQLLETVNLSEGSSFGKMGWFTLFMSAFVLIVIVYGVKYVRSHYYAIKEYERYYNSYSLPVYQHLV